MRRRRLFVARVSGHRHRHFRRTVVVARHRNVRVNGARVDPRRFEKRGVEPQAPKADKQAKPGGTAHDEINTITMPVVRQSNVYRSWRIRIKAAAN
jgi:hypothetical protein